MRANEVHDKDEYLRIVAEEVADTVEASMWLELWGLLEGRGDWHFDRPDDFNGPGWGYGLNGEQRLAAGVSAWSFRVLISEADPGADSFRFGSTQDLAQWLDKNEPLYTGLSAKAQMLDDCLIQQELDEHRRDSD